MWFHFGCFKSENNLVGTRWFCQALMKERAASLQPPSAEIPGAENIEEGEYDLEKEQKKKKRKRKRV